MSVERNTKKRLPSGGRFFVLPEDGAPNWLGSVDWKGYVDFESCTRHARSAAA